MSSLIAASRGGKTLKKKNNSRRVRCKPTEASLGASYRHPGVNPALSICSWSASCGRLAAARLRRSLRRSTNSTSQSSVCFSQLSVRVLHSILLTLDSDCSVLDWASEERTEVRLGSYIYSKQKLTIIGMAGI